MDLTSSLMTLSKDPPRSMLSPSLTQAQMISLYCSLDLLGALEEAVSVPFAQMCHAVVSVTFLVFVTLGHYDKTPELSKTT